MAIKHLPASPAIDRFLSLYPLPFYYRCHLVWLSHLEEKLKSDISDAPPPRAWGKEFIFRKMEKNCSIFSLICVSIPRLSFFFQNQKNRKSVQVLLSFCTQFTNSKPINEFVFSHLQKGLGLLFPAYLAPSACSTRNHSRLHSKTFFF